MRKIGPFTAVGVAYDTQKIGHIPADPHDQPLDLIVTDRQVYKAKSES
jgi:5-formyltetrahydrofolate cyclo-ligase